jgi:predicted transcriptional regulator
MASEIPSGVEIRATLLVLSHSQMQELSRLSGVPFTTLWKVRSGETKNPGIETVRQFASHIDAAKQNAERSAAA